MRVRFALLGIVAAGSIQLASAQGLNVKGLVRDTKGNPVMGATIAVKGQKPKAMTDVNGEFLLKDVKPSDMLVISYIGMEKQEVKAQRNLSVTLTDDDTELNEVMVVAFGKQKRESFTGSAGVVNSDQLEKRQVTNALSAINGEVAGVQMLDVSGDPASTPTIRIRGFSSINAGNDPLVILDGAPYDGGINNINPSDIASVTVLKDAASNALYGARGANGVIMITTKSAQRGADKTSINFDAKWGTNSNAAVDYDYIKSPGEYYEMFYRAMNNYYKNNGYGAYDAHVKANQRIYASPGNGGLGYVDYTVPKGEYLIGENGRLNPHATLGNLITNNGKEYTILPDDWTDAAFRNALRQEYNLNISSSLKNAQIYASLGYLNNEGIALNTDYERYTARFKANWQATKWLQLGGNTSFAHSNRHYVADDATGLFWTLRNVAPIYPLYIRDGKGNIMTDQNGYLYDYGDGQVLGDTHVRKNLSTVNPIQENALNTNETVYNNLTLNGFVNITPLEGLKITLNGTVNNNQSRGVYTYNPFYGFSATSYVNGGIQKVQTQTYSVNFQQLIDYTRTFGLHNVDLMVGHESYKYRYDYLSATKQNMASYFGNQNLSGAITVMTASDSPTSDYNNEGWFMRAQYDFGGRYFASFSFRRDASSRFHPDHRWGNFFSFGGAWIVSKEHWFKASWVDQLKVKASMGQQGNDNIGDFYYTDLYSIKNNNGTLGLVWSRKGNPDISWETNTNVNAGLEFSLWKGRLTGSFEYFYRHTTNMLSFIAAPYEAGYAGSYYNVGNMDNKGVEINLTGVIIRNRNLTWSVNLNATHYKNEVTKLAESVKTSHAEGYGGYVSSYSDQFTGEGLPLFTWYLKKYAGVNEEGLSTWYTEDGGTTTQYGDAGYFLCGSSIPKVYGGFGTSLSAYGFDLSVNFNYSVGGKAYDYNYASLMQSPYDNNIGGNFHKDLLNAWSETNKNSDIPRFMYGDTYSASQSDRFLTNASYLSLQNINLGYTLPKKWVSRLKLSSIRIYGSADNICYWSKRKGFDPRGSFNGETSTTIYSPMRTISGGINIQF